MTALQIKLEQALRTHLATYTGTGQELNGVDVRAGYDSTVQGTQDRLFIAAAGSGGPLANVGNEEIQVDLIFKTHASPTASETAADLVAAHAARVEAVRGILGEGQIATVCTALAAIDPELGVSAFWGFDRQDGREDDYHMTSLRKVFQAHLV